MAESGTGGHFVEGKFLAKPFLVNQVHEPGNGDFTRGGLGHPVTLHEKVFDKLCAYRHILNMFLRRLGPDPHANGAMTSSLRGCPDILELETGDFAVIGVDITEQAESSLAFGASRGPDERIVRIPRKTLVLAKADIPGDV